MKKCWLVHYKRTFSYRWPKQRENTLVICNIHAVGWYLFCAQWEFHRHLTNNKQHQSCNKAQHNSIRWLVSTLFLCLKVIVRDLFFVFFFGCKYHLGRKTSQVHSFICPWTINITRRTLCKWHNVGLKVIISDLPVTKINSLDICVRFY